jgi:hypothetical protein
MVSQPGADAVGCRLHCSATSSALNVQLSLTCGASAVRRSSGTMGDAGGDSECQCRVQMSGAAVEVARTLR